jgi:hypothetical protein
VGPRWANRGGTAAPSSRQPAARFAEGGVVDKQAGAMWAAVSFEFVEFGLLSARARSISRRIVLCWATPRVGMREAVARRLL